MTVQSLTPRQAFALTRDRQRIATIWLYSLLAVALLPLCLGVTRLLAQASVEPYGILAVGEWLNQHLRLSWVSYRDRDVVLYILLLPLAALLTAVTRLTLGIRVLGFRAILIAIGFQEIGILPCLLLILIIALTVVLVRPLMRRSGLPLFARVAVILCIVALTMVAGLLSGVWLDSPTLWSMAFFPVVILAMLAESIAKTVARESITVAIWRTGTTIALALFIAGISQITLLQELLVSCPELLVTVLVLIVFVAEFLDLRLLEDFRPGVRDSRVSASQRPAVVVLRNRFSEAPIRRAASQPPRRYRRASLQPLIDGLRRRGFDVSVLEADSTLPAALMAAARQAFKPGAAGMAVLNFASGVQGAGCLTQAPVICEMLGVPYAGPAPQAPALLDDRLLQVQRLRLEGLSVPSVLSYSDAVERLREDEACVVWARGRFAADRGPSAVRCTDQLRRICKKMQRRFGDVLLEEKPPGRAITAVLVHPEHLAAAREESDQSRQPSLYTAVVLPLLERAGDKDAFREAQQSPQCRHAVEAAALKAARVLGCRDCARVDVYCTDTGAVTIARVLAIDPLTRRSAAAVAARLAGIQPAELAEMMIEGAIKRANNSARLATTAAYPATHPSIDTTAGTARFEETNGFDKKSGAKAHA